MLFIITILLGFHQVRAADFNLAPEVRPYHYDLKYTFDMDPSTNFSFYAVVNIWLTTTKPTSKIVLHAQNFEIDTERVVLSSRKHMAPAVADVQALDQYQFLEVNLEHRIKENVEYTLTIPFYGNVRKVLDGIYISTYQSSTSKTEEYLLASQFEALNARKGFPCFDEPSFKATFRITIGHPRDFKALSNMPIRKTTDNNALVKQWPWHMVEKTFKKPQKDFEWDHFEKSVPMSTYLVALVISNFTYTESHDKTSMVKFRTWTRNDAIEQTRYAASIGPKILSYFEKYYNVRYPLPKLDMVAIPDFFAGAMENWGLVLYSERALLYDKDQSSLEDKYGIVMVIAHELAHQWFGNLVTMKWWSDLWLNEGFATQAMYGGLAYVNPTWNVEYKQILNILDVFTADSLPSSRPVSSPLNSINDINSIFDDIAYRKGAILLRMVYILLGEKMFRKAVNSYLTKNIYSNADRNALWTEMDIVSKNKSMLPPGLSINEVMESWTRKPGYPLLDVTRDYGRNTMTLQQSRYLPDQSNATYSWWIPLSILAGGKKTKYWMTANRTRKFDGREVVEHSAGDDELVLINYDMMTLMRVNYDEKNWNLIIATLHKNHREVPVAARVQLLADAFALAWSNKLDYTMTLRLASYLEQETEQPPIKTALDCLKKIENVLIRTKDYGAYQKFMRKLITKPYRNAGGLYKKKILNDQNMESVSTQVITSEAACRAHVPGCQENAIELFQQWMDTPNPDEFNPIPRDLRRAVYCAALSRGGVLHWRFAARRRARSSSATTYDDLTNGLACTPHVWLLQTYLEWAITEDSAVRNADALHVFLGVLRSPAGFYVAKEFIYDRIEDIAKAFSDQLMNLAEIIKSLLLQITTEKGVEEFILWSNRSHAQLSPVWRSVQLGVERARAAAAWRRDHARHVVDVMRQFTSDYADPMCEQIKSLYKEKSAVGDYDDSGASNIIVNTVLMCWLVIIVELL